MKKLIAIAVFATALSTGLQAQDKKAPVQDSISYPQMQLNKYYSIYQLANQFNDPAVARMALYEMLMYTGNQTAILDSLAIQYYSMRQYPSAAIVSQENLKLNPDNPLALEIAAISFEALGVYDKALDNYESLFLKNNDTQTLYQVALLQFELDRLKEAKTSADLLLQRKDVGDIMLTFSKADKTQQEVSMRAAVLNLQGLMAQEGGDKTKAQELYLEALNAAPGFELVQLNLKKLKEAQ